MNSDAFFTHDILDETMIDETQDPDYMYVEPTKLVKRKRISGKKAKLEIENKKQMLGALIKKEEVIWNRRHKLHRNGNALNLAWKRVANKMLSMNVQECRTMWKSIKDAIRYRRKIASNSESRDIDDEEFVVETEESECANTLSFTEIGTDSSQKNTMIADTTNDEESSEYGKKIKVMKNKETKRVLVELMKVEELIWNTQHELHFNSDSVEEAWKRIAEKMPGMTVERCKLLWRNLRVGIRKRSATKEKPIVQIMANSGNSDGEDYFNVDEDGNEFPKILSLFTPTTSKFCKNVLRHDSMDYEETSLSRVPSNCSSNASEQSENMIEFEDYGNEDIAGVIKEEKNVFYFHESATTVHDRDKTENKKIIGARKYNAAIKNEKEKRMLVELLKTEKVIWDIEHEFHFSNDAMDDAWKRVAYQMPNKMTIDQCRTMWRSLKDALRYRRKVAAKENGEQEIENSNLLEDILSLFTPNTRKFVGKTSAPEATNCSETNNSRPASNCSYVSANDMQDELSESLASISKAIDSLVTVAKNPRPSQAPATLKYDYVWRLIESLYSKMDELTINEVNQRIINLVYEHCRLKKD